MPAIPKDNGEIHAENNVNTLVGAIIYQAIKDYKRIKEHEERTGSKKNINIGIGKGGQFNKVEIKNFFKSNYFNDLTNDKINGNWIIEHIDEVKKINFNVQSLK